MDDYCIKPTGNLVFLINVVLHVLILFTLLSLIFTFYISNVEKQAFEEEFDNLIDSNVPNVLHQVNDATNGALKVGLKGASSPLGALEKLYSQPSQTNKIYNDGLRKMNILIGIVILMTLVAIVLTLKLSCNQCVPLWDIIKENLVVFAFVGVAEFMFFTYIASKYVPSPPSLLASSFFDSLKENMTNNN